MNRFPYGAAALCLLSVAVNSGCKQTASKVSKDATPKVVQSFTFEEVAIGAIPLNWQVAETNGVGSLAVWRVEEASSSNAQGRVFNLAETKNSGRTYNLALAPQAFPADLKLSVRLLAGSGSEDQGGGLVWRALDANNYYIARWNPLENNLRAYKVVAGRRSMLSTADFQVPADRWHELAVTVLGSRILVSLDGTQYLDLKDETFVMGGLIGLWTKADAATFFDDLTIESVIEQ